MGIEYSYSRIHWNYFLALEQDFQVVSRFIEPCESNNNTFSIELARIIMASAQEVDVVLKSLCKLLDEEANAGGIKKYFKTVSEHIPEMLDEEVRITRFSMSSKPWENWEEEKPPRWWTANNKIKHHRSSQYHKATLKNAYNSLAALLIVTSYFYKKEMQIETPNIDWQKVTGTLKPASSLFRLSENYYYGDVVFAGEPEW